jgi:membrane-anchored glycerophosphoryl diester phosphodiesterase (GDPDase)
MVIQQSLLVGVLLGLSLFLSVRLVVLGPVVIASRAGPIAALRLAWELTAGAFWRLLGVLLIYSIGGMVVVLASAFAIGAILVLGGKAIGVPDLGAVLSTVYLRVALAIFWMGFHVLGTALYRQLGGTIRGA